ncbi:hypothetical protein CDD82_6653 [Ophiocordyceps australis]|uniref:Uncharacterized protein n=1 Tax=Ophiocordyceps australis TaxID=1399860 RepID=A0A2C5ZS23_9HYPO|nr:hypothetical protein CDD82_6653 [Ophiocordyceps australis]
MDVGEWVEAEGAVAKSEAGREETRRRREASKHGETVCESVGARRAQVLLAAHAGGEIAPRDTASAKQTQQRQRCASIDENGMTQGRVGGHGISRLAIVISVSCAKRTSPWPPPSLQPHASAATLLPFAVLFFAALCCPAATVAPFGQLRSTEYGAQSRYSVSTEYNATKLMDLW